MITFLMGLGLAEDTAKIVGRYVLPLLGVIAAIAAFFAVLNAYGDSRFREGRAVENAAWMLANDKLLAEAAAASSSADAQDLALKLDHTEKLKDEKEKIDDAIDKGGSPLDVLFGPR